MFPSTAFTPIQNNKKSKSSAYTPLHSRGHNDIAFAILYATCSVSALILCIKSPAISLAFTSTTDYSVLFSSFFLSIGLLGMFVCQTRTVTWVVLGIVPVCSLMFAGMLIWAKVNVYTAVFALLTTAFTVFAIRVLNTKAIRDSINIIELSCKLVLKYPVLAVSSLSLLIPYALFTTTLINLFSSLAYNTQKTGLNIWETGLVVGWYLWTCQMLKYYLRVGVASVVGRWYFEDADLVDDSDEGEEVRVCGSDYNDESEDDDDIPPTTLLFASETKMSSSPARDITLAGIIECGKSAATKSIGSIAFAALILATLEVIKGVLQAVQKLSNSRYAPPLSNSITTPLSTLASTLHSFTSSLNSYTLVYLGISGQPFLASTAASTRLFRRNLITGLTCSSVLRIVLITLATGIPSVAGIVMRCWGVGVEHAAAVFYVALLTAGFGCVFVESVVDSMFMCFIVDVDGDAVRFSEAHLVFGELVQ